MPHAAAPCITLRLAVRIASSIASTSLIAQCEPAWLPGAPMIGCDGPVNAVVAYDPDGAGPLGAGFAVGGVFGVAGGGAARNLAFFDPTTGSWSELGGGVGGSVQALAVLPTGELVVAGPTSVGAVPVGQIAVWNGAAWDAMGGGASGLLPTVQSLCVLPNGDLLVGGGFTAMSGIAASRLARWDGATWQEFAGGVQGTFANVRAIDVTSSGDVLVAGLFQSAGGVSTGSVARWNGTTWSPLGTSTSTQLSAVEALANGDVLVGGAFSSIGGVVTSGLARWNGTSWSGFGPGIAGPSASVQGIRQLPTGDVLAWGWFTSVAGVSARGIARWDGATWSGLGDGVESGISPATASGVNAVVPLATGEVVVGGQFRVAGGELAANLAQWDGAAWRPVPAAGAATLWGPAVPQVIAVAELPDGDLVVGGLLSRAGALSVGGVARWDGVAWQDLGGGTDGTVLALATLPNGDLAVGGQFMRAGGVVVKHLARWDGVSWSSFGGVTGVPTAVRVRSLVVAPNGDLIVGGQFVAVGEVVANNVARWDGAAWSPMGAGVMGLMDLEVGPGGDVYAAGWDGSQWAVFRWDGVGTWTSIGTAAAAVVSLAASPNGDLLAGGAFTSLGGAQGRVVRWDGAAWSAVGGTWSGAEVRGLAALPGGDVVVGQSGNSGGWLRRFSGGNWSPLPEDANGSVRCITALRDGSVAVGGEFTSIGSAASTLFARLAPSCPALAVPSGDACGQMDVGPELAAVQLPWTGAGFVGQVTGLQPLDVVLTVFGASQAAVPLTSFVPQAVPSCLLLVAPDSVELSVAGSGSASTSLPVPQQPSLVGTVLHHQALVLRPGASGAVASALASNRLTLTIGSL